MGRSAIAGNPRSRRHRGARGRHGRERGAVAYHHGCLQNARPPCLLAGRQPFPSPGEASTAARRAERTRPRIRLSLSGAQAGPLGLTCSDSSAARCSTPLWVRLSAAVSAAAERRAALQCPNPAVRGRCCPPSPRCAHGSACGADRAVWVSAEPVMRWLVIPVRSVPLWKCDSEAQRRKRGGKRTVCYVD